MDISIRTEFELRDGEGNSDPNLPVPVSRAYRGWGRGTPKALIVGH